MRVGTSQESANQDRQTLTDLVPHHAPRRRRIKPLRRDSMVSAKIQVRNRLECAARFYSDDAFPGQHSETRVVQYRIQSQPQDQTGSLFVTSPGEFLRKYQIKSDAERHKSATDHYEDCSAQYAFRALLFGR